MPSRYSLLYGAVGLLFSTALSAQAPTAHPGQQKMINEQLRQQRQWFHKQLPVNSVLYKTETLHSGMYFQVTQKQPLYNGIRLPIYQEVQPGLNYRFTPVEWGRSPWWKDPSKGIGAELLRSIIAPASPMPLKN